MPLPAGSGDDEYLRGLRELVEPADARRSSPSSCSSRPASTRTARIPLADMAVSEDGFRELAAGCAALGPRVAAVLEGGYNLETLPRLVAAALAGFSGP